MPFETIFQGMRFRVKSVVGLSRIDFWGGVDTLDTNTSIAKYFETIVFHLKKQ